MASSKTDLSRKIESDGDERINLSRVGRGEIVVSVLPDEDEDDCLAEATEYVSGLYGQEDGVASVTCVGWNGGFDGPRDRVLVRIGGRVA